MTAKTFGFDEAVDPEEKMIPEGDYFFTVMAVDKGKKKFGDKLGECFYTEVKVALKSADTDDEETYSIEETLVHAESIKWKFLAFFAAIGQREHGDKKPFMPNYKTIVGSSGVCGIGVRKGDGKYRDRNEVARWGEPRKKDEESVVFK